MKPPKTVQPLPRYTIRRWVKSERTWGYFFQVPAAYRAAGCTVRSEALGRKYEEAVRRVEEVLLPALDSWRTDGASDAVPDRPSPTGTMEWLRDEFLKSRAFLKTGRSQQDLYRRGLKMVADYKLKDGRRFGDLELTKITPLVVDALYEKIAFVTEVIAGPTGPEERTRERRTMANHAMRACRRAWFACRRLHGQKVPADNPFAKMGMTSKSKETPTASLQDLQTFVAAADAAGLASIGTGALIMWEWLQRVEHVFTAFEVGHYRPRERPDAVRVVHPKTGEEAWIPLYAPADDGSGALLPLYPQLMARLDAIKRDRIGGLMLVRDWADEDAGVPLPWPAQGQGGLRYLRARAREVIKAAGIRDGITLTSFRHGGFTEGADAGLSDRELQAIGRHKTVQTLPRYAKRTMKQVASAQKKRLLERTKARRDSD